MILILILYHKPVPEKYEGKELIVYYVNTSNIVTPYDVTVKDGYATFETDHFSTYTLTTIANPATGDNVMLYFILLGVSVVGMLGLPVYIKTRK